MKFYTLYNNYTDYLSKAIISKTPSVVDFGTAMANKRKTKRNGRK